MGCGGSWWTLLASVAVAVAAPYIPAVFIISVYLAVSPLDAPWRSAGPHTRPPKAVGRLGFVTIDCSGWLGLRSFRSKLQILHAEFTFNQI